MKIKRQSRAVISRNDTHCIFDEEVIIQLIEEETEEIGIGNSQIMKFDVYDAIKDNAPNMLFMDYKQSDQLQRVVAKRCCPEIEPAHLNIKGSRDFYFRLSDYSYVFLDDWLSAKGELLEWSLHLKKEIECQPTTRRMEDRLLDCKDGIIKASELFGSKKHIEVTY